jgi:hypothetical protein
LFNSQEKYNLEKKYEETYSLLKIKENQILVLQTEVSMYNISLLMKYSVYQNIDKIV